MIEHRKNHCNTTRHSTTLAQRTTTTTTTTTMKMSTTTTSSPNRKHLSFKRRCSLRRMLHLTLLGFLLLQLQVLHSAHATADYGDDGGSSSELTSANNNDSNSDDIYEPALLQQVVEASEQRNEDTNSGGEQAINDTKNNDQQSELPTAARVNVSTNQISTENTLPLDDDSNITREEINNMKESSYEYSNDDDTTMSGGSLEAMHGRINAELLTAQISATLPTTMIPEYLQRKAKAQPFNVPTMAAAASEDDLATPNNEENEEEDDVSASISDYMDDEDVGADDAREYQPSKQAEDVPLAMKFYRTAEIEEDNNLANLQDQQLQQLNPPVPMPQQQLLPEQHLDRQFHNNSEEEYYEDSRDQSLELLNKLNAITTTAPATTYAAPSTTAAATSTSAPAIRRNDIVLAGFGGLSLPWTTAAVNKEVTVTTATVGLPEYATQAATAAAATTTTATATMNLAGSAETTSTATTLTPTTVASTTTTATTSRPAGGSGGGGGNNKQGKQINVLRRKMLPHEQLRNYIEDAYIRMPLAVIVDPSSASLEKTKALWRDALRTNLNIKIVLVSLNASGAPAAYSFNNTRQFLAGLNSIKENDGGNAFIGIVQASELVPYDSAVFISTAAIPPHTELVQDTAITLLKKRIRLYVIWYGERSISENETQEGVGGILGEVAIRSGGEVLHIVGSEDSQELEGNTPTLIADAFRGSQEVDLPVDTTLSSLHVKIDSPMRMATLETPNGDINLKKLLKFKSRILTQGPGDNRLDAYVPLTKLRKATVFTLKLVPESMKDEYFVVVRADRKADLFLDDMIKRFDAYFLEGISPYPAKFRDTRLNSITAALAAATIPTHDNLRFPEEEDEGTEMDIDEPVPKSEVEIFSENEIDSKQNKTAIANNNEALFTNTQRTTNVLQQGATKIEMGTQSQVLVAPGMLAQLYFEITNTRSEGVYHNIQVIDERRFLQRLSQQSIFLPPGETTTITVTVLVPATTPQGTVDKITFTCHGSPTVSLSLNLKVITTQDTQDTTAPELTWSYSSRCDNIDSNSASCSQRFWILDITAQDWQTGILRVESNPATGFIYRNTYTVGSTEPLRASYIASCCEPKVSLVAHDLARNQRSYTIDVRDLVLTEASIAAIVLGVLLLILLIILVVILIVWCCRKRRVTLDLPTYRSHSTRSMD